MDRMVQTKKAQVWVKRAVVFVKKITGSQWHVSKDLEGTSGYMRSEIDDLHLEKDVTVPEKLKKCWLRCISAKRYPTCVCSTMEGRQRVS